MAGKVSTSKPTEKSVNAPPPIAAGPQQTSSLANVPPSAVTVGGPPPWLMAQMNGAKPRGMERVDNKDLVYPRLVLVQGTTKGVSTGEFAVGEMRDNISRELLCARGERLEFIPVIYNKTRIQFGENIDDPAVCRSLDSLTAVQPNGRDQGGLPTKDCSKCVLQLWDDSAEDGAPACTEIHNIVCTLPQHGGRAIVISMKGTSNKVAKRFLSVCAQGNVDFWARKFTLFAKVEQATNSKGTFDFQNFDFEKVGWVTPEEYADGLRLYEKLRDKTWDADQKEMEIPEAEIVVEPGTPPAASTQTVDAAPVAAPPPVAAEPEKKDPKRVPF